MLNQRKKVIKLLGAGVIWLLLSGCSGESLLIEQTDTREGFLEEWTGEEVLSDSSVQEQKKQNEEGSVTGEKSAVSEVEGSITEKKASISEADEKKEEELAVHICGAVNQPGVYLFQQKARVYEGIQKAGGFREDAARDYLNLALLLEDGMKVEVPTREMAEAVKKEESQQIVGISYGNQEGKEASSGKGDGRIDLNTADEALLCTLPGIGESKAKSIIAYRQENGGFEKTEDIMKISGIKESAYEKIKDFVMVSGAR